MVGCGKYRRIGVMMGARRLILSDADISGSFPATWYMKLGG
jgi:hypothetical protein